MMNRWSGSQPGLIGFLSKILLYFNGLKSNPQSWEGTAPDRRNSLITPPEPQPISKILKVWKPWILPFFKRSRIFLWRSEIIHWWAGFSEEYRSLVLLSPARREYSCCNRWRSVLLSIMAASLAPSLSYPANDSETWTDLQGSPNHSLGE